MVLYVLPSQLALFLINSTQEALKCVKIARLGVLPAIIFQGGASGPQTHRF